MPVALKQYDHSQAQSLNAFISEIESATFNSKLIRHPNIVQILGAYQTNSNSFILTELSDHGNLLKVIKDQPQLSITTKIKACIQILTSIQYLHSSLNTVHRDIKAENILVFAINPQRHSILVKLCDFGISSKNF
jgi:serine/threonine protein kinase